MAENINPLKNTTIVVNYILDYCGVPPANRAAADVVNLFQTIIQFGPQRINALADSLASAPADIAAPQTESGSPSD